MFYSIFNSTFLFRSASQGEDMMLESKYFPGHPGLNPGPTLYPSPTFSRKDIFNQRKQREFIPENKKDDSYWDRRRRNNEAAKRSREKRRLNDMLLENRVLELTKDNHILQAQLNAIYEKYGIKGENLICMDQVLATLPTNDQVLNFTKKRMGSLASLSPRAMSPFQSLSLPLKMNSSGMNNNSSSFNNNNGGMRSPPPQSPESYRAASPSPSAYPMRPSLHQNFTDIRAYAETGHMYSRAFSAPRFAVDDSSSPHDDKDSGLALNLSTDRAGSDGRSSGTGSPPVQAGAGCVEREGSSSGDESGYPRSPNSGNESCLPHKLRFKSVATEKEAVSSLLSLHQIAMIKREPTEAIHSWMDKLPGTPVFPGLINTEKADLMHHSREPDHPHDHQSHPSHHHHQQQQPEEEPALKRVRTTGPPDHITDEVARLTNEVATLKNILVNRMKEEWDGGADRSGQE